MKFYLLPIWGGVEPESLIGPFEFEAERDQAAQHLRAEMGRQEVDIYWMDVEGDSVPVVGAYSGAFFEEADQAYEDSREPGPRNPGLLKGREL